MPKYIVDGSDLTSVANTIRTKGGTSGSLSFPNGWNSAINAIGGGGLEYEEGTITPSEDLNQITVTFQNLHSSAPFFALVSDATGTYSNEEDSIQLWQQTAWMNLFGGPFTSQSSQSTGSGENRYRASNGGLGSVGFNVASNLTNTGFLTNLSGTRYFQTGRTYKWIAVWAPTT